MSRSMKAVLPGVLIVCLFGLSVQAAPPLPAVPSSPGQKVPGPNATPHTLGKPDLVVDLSLVTEKYDDPGAPGLTCYNVTPRYTVTNKGRAPAAGFSIVMEWKPGPGTGWQIWGTLPTMTLNPGQSYIQEPNPAARTKWCEGYGYKAVGFRVTADNGKIITESNEENNTAERLFPSMPVPGLKPELIEKKRN